MKRVLIGVCAAALLVAAFVLGRIDGVRHAIEDSELCVVEFNDEEVLQKGYDLRIWIDLDGQSYEHFGYIG